MDKLGKLIESITKPRHEEDFMDRLNYRVTGYVLLLAAFTIIAKEYGGDPMQCWLPAELATQRGWEQYARDYCFVESTYFVPMDSRISQSSRFRKEKRLTYYQWVPFMLLFQALMFTVPHIFWRMLNWTSGVHTRAVITMASNAASMNFESKEMTEIVDAIVKHLNRSLMAKSVIYRYTHSNPLIALSRIFALSYLSTIYLLTKILFIANGVFQFWLLTVYLGANGFEVTKNLWGDQSWQQTGLFPRVTLCDFKVRGLGNHHRHTIQCVLMANMFNEKIFIALWWWISVLITLTSANFIYWIYVVFSSQSKYAFVKGLVQLGQPEQRLNEHNLDLFKSYLGGDGVLLFRLMTQNAGDLVSSIIAAKLYDTFCAARTIQCNGHELEKLKIPPPLLATNFGQCNGHELSIDGTPKKPRARLHLLAANVEQCNGQVVDETSEKPEISAPTPPSNVGEKSEIRLPSLATVQSSPLLEDQKSTGSQTAIDAQVPKDGVKEA